MDYVLELNYFLLRRISSHILFDPEFFVVQYTEIEKQFVTNGSINDNRNLDQNKDLYRDS
jgi:hypothetical protein